MNAPKDHIHILFINKFMSNILKIFHQYFLTKSCTKVSNPAFHYIWYGIIYLCFTGIHDHHS